MASKKNPASVWRYSAVVAACFGLGWGAPQLPPAERINNNAYDELTARFRPDWTLHSVVVGIDEQTFCARRGMPHMREIEARRSTRSRPEIPRPWPST